MTTLLINSFFRFNYDKSPQPASLLLARQTHIFTPIHGSDKMSAGTGWSKLDVIRVLS